MNYRFSIVILIVCLIATDASGQVVIPDAQSMGMAGAMTGARGMEGIFFNPAGLETSRNGFLLNMGLLYPAAGLGNLSAAGLFRTGKYTMGAGLSILGDDLYQFTEMAAALSRDFGSFRLGLRTAWLRETAEGLRSGSSFRITAGTQWQLSDKLYIGLVLIQPVRTHPGMSAGNVSAGIYWEPAARLAIAGAWNSNSTRGISAGIRYDADPRLGFSCGIRFGQVRWYTGIHYRLGRKQMAYSLAADPYLGPLHALSVRWHNNEEQ